MSLKTIPVESFQVKPHDAWANQWYALVAGDYEKNEFNAMTVAWGSFGTMWHKPFAQIVVRPTRYTFEFLEKYESFTLNAFSIDYRKALQILGSRSGKDCDKIKEAGLTPVASSRVKAPCFNEANMVIECVTMYKADFEPSQFVASDIDKLYPKKDYHRVYFGEIVEIRG